MSIFNLNHALLFKHWDLQNIMDNMEKCNELLSTHTSLLGRENLLMRPKLSDAPLIESGTG